MTIRLPAAPPNGHDLIARALADIAPHPSVAAALARGGGPEASDAIQVFVVGLDDIQTPDFLGQARPVGWHYIVGFGDDVSIAALGQSPTNAVEFQSLTHGLLAQRLTAALHVADDVAGAEAGTSELRLLEVPSLYLSAVWLHGSEDRFIPYLDESRGRDFAPALDPGFQSHALALAQRRRALLAGARDTAG